MSFVSKILRIAPQVQLLVTSRERLPLREEQAFPIIGLEYAGEKYDDRVEYAAAQLFLQAAGRAKPCFELAPDEAASLARVCRLLEGMPLGIELAATWVDVLSLADIAAEIQCGIDFLEAEWQDAPARHRSVRAAIDASWRRLTEAEQLIFVELCVFGGGFTRAAASEVTGADLRTLARLVDKSLLSFSRTRERYDVHELLRQYGCDRLATDPTQERSARDRHSAYFCDALGRWGDANKRGKRLEAGVDFEADWANLRAAWEWAADQANATRLDLALDGLRYLVEVSGRWEDGEQLHKRVFDGLTLNSQLSAGHTRRVLAKAHVLGCGFPQVTGKWDLYQSHLRQVEALLEDPMLDDVDTRAEEAQLHVVLGVDAAPDFDAVRWHFQQALALQRELGYEGEAALRVLNIAWTHAEQKNYTQARRGGEEALRLSKAQGNELGVLQSLYMLGNFAQFVPDLRESERFFRELVTRAAEFGSVEFEALGLRMLGVCAILKANYDEAEKLLEDCCELAHRTGSLTMKAPAMRLLGETAWLRGNVDMAERRLTETLGQARRALLPGEAALAQRWLSYIACAAGEYDRAEALCEEILAGLREHDHFERGVAKLALACVARFRGDATLAVKRFQECLQDLLRTISWGDAIRALEGLSWAQVDLDRYEETAQLLGFLAAERDRTGMILPPVDQPHHERALNAAREGLGDEAFTSAWESGGALTLEEAVDFALESPSSRPTLD